VILFVAAVVVVIKVREKNFNDNRFVIGNARINSGFRMEIESECEGRGGWKN
jgi:hypothetical protein